MSSKFWTRVLEAGIDNVNTFRDEIEEEEKQKPSYGALTFNYMINKRMREQFNTTSYQLENLHPNNRAMILPNDEPPIVNFKEELKSDLDVLNRQIMEEYDLMKEYFSSEMVSKLKERKLFEEIDIQNVSAKVGDVALFRDKLKVETRDNDRWLAMLHLYRTKIKFKHRIFNWWKKEAQNSKFAKRNLRVIDGGRKHRLFRRIFDAWRNQAHGSYKQKQIESEPMYYEQRRIEVIQEWDDLIDGLRGYIEQLQHEIKVEVTAKAELIKIYESVMNGSVVKFKKENEFVNSQVGEYRRTVGFDTLARDEGKASMAKYQDIGRITLTQQIDPEEEEKANR